MISCPNIIFRYFLETLRDICPSEVERESPSIGQLSRFGLKTVHFQFSILRIILSVFKDIELVQKKCATCICFNLPNIAFRKFFSSPSSSEWFNWLENWYRSIRLGPTPRYFKIQWMIRKNAVKTRWRKVLAHNFPPPSPHRNLLAQKFQKYYSS